MAKMALFPQIRSPKNSMNQVGITVTPLAERVRRSNRTSIHADAAARMPMIAAAMAILPWGFAPGTAAGTPPNSATQDRNYECSGEENRGDHQANNRQPTTELTDLAEVVGHMLTSLRRREATST